MLLTCPPFRLLQARTRGRKGVQGWQMTITCAAQEGYAGVVQDFLLADPSCVNERDGCAPQCISCRISASRLPLPRLTPEQHWVLYPALRCCKRLHEVARLLVGAGADVNSRDM
jgi:hypothetical protein